MEGNRKAAGETVLCHPRLVDLALCYVISSFVPTSSPKKGIVRPWATRNVLTSCTPPRGYLLAVSIVVALAIHIPQANLYLTLSTICTHKCTCHSNYIPGDRIRQ